MTSHWSHVSHGHRPYYILALYDLIAITILTKPSTDAFDMRVGQGEMVTYGKRFLCLWT